MSTGLDALVAIWSQQGHVRPRGKAVRALLQREYALSAREQSAHESTLSESQEATLGYRSDQKAPWQVT